MKKMKLPRVNKYVGMLLVALVLAGLAVYLTITYLHNQKSQYQEELKSKLTQGMAQVVVPRGNLPAGTIVDGSNMAQRLFPRDLLYPDTVTADKWKKFAGRPLRRAVQVGKPLLDEDFNSEVISEFAALLKNNHRAVTIGVDDLNSISGMVQPGDRIDVMMIRGDSSKTHLLPVLRHIRVLATGSKVLSHAPAEAGAADKAGSDLSDQYSTMTLDLTPSQASDLMMARQIGTLKLALSPEKINPGEPSMPKLTGQALVDRLSGRDKRPRMHGVGGVEFIIGSTQGLSSRRTYAGMAPVHAAKPAKPVEPLSSVDVDSSSNLQQKATHALTNLMQARTPTSDQPGTSTGGVQ